MKVINRVRCILKEEGAISLFKRGIAYVKYRLKLVWGQDLYEQSTSQIARDQHEMGSESVPHHEYSIFEIYPHDRRAFTQGLVFEDGSLFESTGLYGKSSLRKARM